MKFCAKMVLCDSKFSIKKLGGVRLKIKIAIFSGVFTFIIMLISSYFIPDSDNKKIITTIIAGLSGIIGSSLAIKLFKEPKH